MAQFSVNAQRFDPYKNFKFKVKWDGKYVAGISKVSALKRTTEVVKHREGGDPSSSRKSPGRTEYDAITLERGVTHDKDFEQWANKVWNFGAGLGGETSLADFRKDIILELYNEAGQRVIGYKIFRCWVSEFQALPDLDRRKVNLGRRQRQCVARRIKGVDKRPDGRGDPDAADRSSRQIEKVAPRFARMRLVNVLLRHVGHSITSYSAAVHPARTPAEAILLINANYVTDCRRIKRPGEY